MGPPRTSGRSSLGAKAPAAHADFAAHSPARFRPASFLREPPRDDVSRGASLQPAAIWRQALSKKVVAHRARAAPTSRNLGLYRPRHPPRATRAPGRGGAGRGLVGAGRALPAPPPSRHGRAPPPAARCPLPARGPSPSPPRRLDPLCGQSGRQLTLARLRGLGARRRAARTWSSAGKGEGAWGPRVRAGLSCRGVPCHHHPGEGSGFAPRSGARTLSSRAPLQAWGLGPGACSRGPAPWAFRGEGGMCPIPCPSRLLSFPRDPLLSLREARPWGRPLHPLGRRRVVAERPWLWCCLVAAWPGVARLEGGRPRCCPGQA